jgi:hypothetical protein
MDQPNVVLPKELRLGAPATMPQSRSYMFKQQAALSNYAPRDTIQINLPRLQRSYLTKDSYLEFEVTFSYKTDATNFAANAISLDTPGALGLIDRIEVYDYLGSTQLESTAGFGQLVALLQDTCVTQDEYSTHWEVTSGGQTSCIVSDFERNSQIPGDALSLNAEHKMYRIQQPSQGEILDLGIWKNDVSGVVAAASATRTIRRRYHLPLFSFLGLLSPKYAPLHNGYTIMITLQSSENAIINAGLKYAYNATSKKVDSATLVKGTDLRYVINNARMCCQILELGPIAESMLLSTTGQQPMIVTTKAYRNYQTSFPAQTSTFRLDLNINVASLTNVLWIMRPSDIINKEEFPSLSRRQRNFLESWYFQYGSSILPQTQGITCYKPMSLVAGHEDRGSEGLIELLKARHMYNQPTHSHLFNRFNFPWDNWVHAGNDIKNKHSQDALPVVANAFRYVTPESFFENGKFACGLDLELVSGRTNEIICGMNTNGMNTSIFGTFNATAAANTVTDTSSLGANAAVPAGGIWVEKSQVDAWCEYDAFINISPGIATTVSF